MRSTLRGLETDHLARVLSSHGSMARVRPSADDAGVAHLVTVDHHASPSAAAIRGWLEQLTEEGFHSVRTGALGPSVRPIYLEAGFIVRQELALLSHELRTLPSGQAKSGQAKSVKLRRSHRHELVAIAALDRRAFGSGWGLDIAGVVDALQATPTCRLRVVGGPQGTPIGFAISGRAGTAAYLQRLAVNPSHQQRGLGAALTIDSLRWARRHHASNVLVNTHVDNDRALRLYRSLGFLELAYQLAVLERKLP